MSERLSRYLPAPVREVVEERYWRPIEQAADFEAFTSGRSTVSDTHPALYADHGIVHVRDVALGVLDLLTVVEGLLLPSRSGRRRATVEGVGVLLAYLHDIGMVEPSQRRRRVHPQWAAQEVYSARFDDIFELLLSSHLELIHRLQSSAPFAVPVETVMREVLALSMCHSKSVVPASFLDDRQALRALVQRAVLTSLDEQQNRGFATHDSSDVFEPSPALVHYADATQAFAWLDSSDPGHTALAADVIDALRLLRSADALRQRGTVLRTSAGYEMFMDTATAAIVYAVSTPDGSTLHLTFGSPIAAGEAAVRRTAVTEEGHLRVWFQVGEFDEAAVRERAASHAASVVLDVQADVLPSLGTATVDPDLEPPRMDGRTMRIELAGDGTGDSFADHVAGRLRALRPDLADRVDVVVDELPEPPMSAEEQERFAAGTAVDTDVATSVMREMQRWSPRADEAAVTPSFDGVRVVRLQPAEVLIEPGTRAGFVYIPTSEGLAVSPLGGYAAVQLAAWQAVGVTGVVRHGERNALVHATCVMDVVAVPAAVFRRTWFRPLQIEDLSDGITERVPSMGALTRTECC